VSVPSIDSSGDLLLLFCGGPAPERSSKGQRHCRDPKRIHADLFCICQFNILMTVLA